MEMSAQMANKEEEPYLCHHWQAVRQSRRHRVPSPKCEQEATVDSLAKLRAVM